VIDLIQGLLGFISKGLRIREEIDEKKKKLQDDALSTVLKVAFETKVYLEEYEHSGTRHRAREIELAMLWTTAAVPVSRVNPRLADLCLSNVDSWINSSDWTEEEVERNRTGMCDIWEGARKLLDR
jgi:hypothetical protein